MRAGARTHNLLPPFQDEKLKKLVEQHGTDSWKSIASHFPVCIYFLLHELVLAAALVSGRRGRCGTGVTCFALCDCVAGEDRWPVSAPLAEGAQPRTGKRTLD